MPTAPAAASQTAMRLVSTSGNKIDTEPTALTEAEERMFRLGATALTDVELLALVLGETSEKTEKLLQDGGGLKSLLLKEALELTGPLGLSAARAAKLLGSVEVGRRAMRSREPHPRLQNPKEIYNYLAPTLGALRREVFHVLCFNPRNVLLADVQAGTGTANTCPVDAREVFAPAILVRATGIVLAHNHPSGDPEPSSQDLQITLQLAQGARALGMKVLDHIIVGDGVYVSLMERGFLGHED